MVMSVNQHTVNAVRRQLWAMNCEAYDVAIVRYDENGHSKKQSVGSCALSGASVLLPDLVRQNARGENVFVRPEPELDRALILVDDIEELDIDKLRDNGLEPCCVVETSPKNLQAWIDFGGTMKPMERKVLARFIAGFVNADPNSADAVHYGRLAGFTNQKESHFGEGRNGGFPFVLCRYAERLVCSKADGARQWATEQATATATGIEPDLSRRNFQQVDVSKLNEVFSRYCTYWQRNENHARREDGTDDLSARDFAVVGRLLREGYDAEKIVPILAESAGRKNNSMDYARRTVDAVKKTL